MTSRHNVEYNALEHHFPFIAGLDRVHTKTGSYIQILGDFSPHLEKYLGEKLPLTSVGLQLLCTWGEAGPRVLYKLPNYRPIDKAQRHQVHRSLSVMNLKVLSHLAHKKTQMTYSPEMSGKPATAIVRCSLKKG